MDPSILNNIWAARFTQGFPQRLASTLGDWQSFALHMGVITHTLVYRTMPSPAWPVQGGAHSSEGHIPDPPQTRSHFASDAAHAFVTAFHFPPGLRGFFY